VSRHAAEQLKKRYGKEVSQRKLLQKIRAGQFVKRSHSASPKEWIYDVEFDGSLLRLVVDENQSDIITALPPVFNAKKQKQGERRARKDALRVDEVEEIFDLAAENQAEEQAIGLRIEELKSAEGYWRTCLIKALQRIQELENQVADLKRL
jgi:hypothetical protein